MPGTWARQRRSGIAARSQGPSPQGPELRPGQRSYSGGGQVSPLAAPTLGTAL